MYVIINQQTINSPSHCIVISIVNREEIKVAFKSKYTVFFLSFSFNKIKNEVDSCISDRIFCFILFRCGFVERNNKLSNWHVHK